MNWIKRTPPESTTAPMLPLSVLALATLWGLGGLDNLQAENPLPAEPHDLPRTTASASDSTATGSNAPTATAWQFFTRTNDLAPASAAPAPDYQLQINTARERRSQLQYPEATAIYAAVVQSAAPENLQRIAMLEMAEVAQEQSDFVRAQQIYAQWLARWPQDPGVPETLLRQGLVYRQMGLHSLAIAKLYAVMTSALVLKSDQFDYYKQLVLRAQNEIAETQYDLGNYAEAVDSFGRLLRLDPPPINRAALQYRFIHCLSALGRRSEAIAQAEEFLTRYPTAPERAEVRFLCATTLKQARREGDALNQVLALLQEQSGGTNGTASSIAYWQRRAGNAIANQFYQEGDSTKALEIYLRLAAIESAPDWQFPVWYQVGLVYERLAQPAKALEYYGNIVQHSAEATATNSPALKTVIEMAAWRKDFLTWHLKLDSTRLELRANPKDRPTDAPPPFPLSKDRITPGA